MVHEVDITEEPGLLYGIVEEAGLLEGYVAKGLALRGEGVELVFFVEEVLFAVLFVPLVYQGTPLGTR